MACLTYMAWCLWCLGYPDQALQTIQEAQVIARQSQHAFNIAWALNFSGRLHEFRREGLEAQTLADEVITISKEQGFAYWLAWATVIRGWGLTEQGHVAEGLEDIRQGLSDIQGTGTEIARSHDLSLLAGAHAQAKNTECGLDIAAEALSFIQRSGERLYEAELHRLRGELILQRVDGSDSPDVLESAENCFLKAIQIAKNQEAKMWELRATVSLCRLWLKQNKQKQVRPLLSTIYNWFTEGFATKDLKEAKALLEEMN